MPDIVDQETRSRMMSGIRAKDTKPEMLIRRALHARGFRARLHSSAVPGKRDLMLARYRAVIFAHGCFWHGHDCPLFRLPGTRRDFWEAKIASNRERDAEVAAALATAGWRRLTVWECAMRGRRRVVFDALMDRITAFLTRTEAFLEIKGQP